MATRNTLAIAAAITLIVIGGIVGAGVFAFRANDGVIEIQPGEPADGGEPFEPPTTASHIFVPISFDSAHLGQVLEGSLPETAVGHVENVIDLVSDDKLAWDLKRGAVTSGVDVEQQLIRAAAPVLGQAKLDFTFKLGKLSSSPSVTADVDGQMQATLSPVVSDNWVVNPRLKLSLPLKAMKVSAKPFGEVDVAPVLRKAIEKLTQADEHELSRQLQGLLPVRRSVEHVWQHLALSTKVDDEPPTWVQWRPRTVSLAPLRYSEQRIDSTVAMAIDIRVFLAEKPPKNESLPLPKLSAPPEMPEQFELVLPVQMSYDTLNAELAKAIADDKIAIPGAGGAWIKISGAAIRPHPAGVLLKLDFSGRRGPLQDTKGQLHLTARPRFDPATSKLAFQNVSYTTETNNALLNAANWLASPVVLDKIKSRAVVDLTGIIEKAKAKTNERIARLKQGLPRDIHVELDIQQLDVDRLAFAKDEAWAIIRARGKASVDIAAKASPP